MTKQLAKNNVLREMQHGLNLVQLSLDMMESPSTVSRLDGLLHPIEKSISKILKSTHDEERPDYEWLVEADCELLEEYLGVSLVICQTAITAVKGDVQRVYKFVPQPAKSSISQQLPENRTGLMQTGSRRIDTTEHTAITLINAFANYYKHKDEWIGAWSQLDGSAKSTVKIIEAFEGDIGCSGNLRQAAEALGITDYSDLSILVKDLRDWQREIHNILRKELTSAKLI